MGDWDNFSNLNNTGQLEGMSQGSSEFGKLGQGDLMGAIKGAKADDKFKEIDDDFEIDPHVGSKKSGPKGFGGRDNLRQGVSSGFNFKELLNSGDHCSEDDDLNSRVSNPLD